MVHKFCLAGFLLVLSSTVCSGQTLTRTWTNSSSHAYAWIDLAGEDFDDDSGAGNTSAKARVQDYSDTTNASGYGYCEADVDAVISPPNQAVHAVQVSGYTSVDSVYSDGYYNTNEVWSPGYTTHFNASGQANVQVTGNGAVGHFVSVGIDVGTPVAEGTIYGWATVGDYQVSFNWAGYDLSVEIFENGSRIDWYTVAGNSNGQYVITESFGQLVTNGEGLQVQAYAIAIENRNAEEEDKFVTVMAATN